MRKDVDNLITFYPKICSLMLVLASKKYKNSPGEPILFPRDLLYASQNKIKSFRSNGSLEGVKDVDTWVIPVAAFWIHLIISIFSGILLNFQPLFLEEIGPCGFISGAT